MYEYTNEQIESRVLADCNRERLKEHRQCDYCHLCFDCNAYKERTGIDLCKFLDDYEWNLKINSEGELKSESRG